VTPLSLTVVTWNVHGFVGADGRRDPERAAAVLAELDADVIALQEVDAGAREADAFASLGPALGYQAIAGPTLTRGGVGYGNLLLCRQPVQQAARLDVSQPGCEPRGAIDAWIDLAGAPVRLLATHLGLSRRERARQAAHLCGALDAEPEAARLVVLLGDLNEWRRPLRGTGLAPLVRRFAARSRARTFPARAPLLALDRVLVDRREARLHPRVVAGERARRASDHLPLWAHIEL
jgi:endonuclease/exonuclease/phosphatase family metal-dependent hydrolase